MIYDDEVRIPCSKEDKEGFQRACNRDNGKKMAPVGRDLIVGFTKAMRKSQDWPVNFEPPNHKDVVRAAIRLLSGEFEGNLN